MPAFTISKPWDRGEEDDSGDVLSELNHRDLFAHLGDGVISDIAGTGLRVTTDGTTVVTLKPGLVKVQGVYGELSADMTFNLSAIGTQPTAGQSRVDVLVARWNGTAKELQAEVVPGTPATTPARPAITRTVGGTWDVPLRSWNYTGAGVTSTVDERTHLGPHLLARNVTGLPADAYMGSTAHIRAKRYLRDLNAAGNPAWLLDENWGTASLTVIVGQDYSLSGLVSHGLGVVPYVQLTPIVDGTAALALSVQDGSKNATTFRIQLRRVDGVFGSTGAVLVDWLAKR